MIRPEAEDRYLVTGGSGFIGTNLVHSLLNAGQSVVNLDLRAPVDRNQMAAWTPCDILDKCEVQRQFDDYRPTHVIHLAGRTDCLGKSVEDYRVNTEGTRWILSAAARTPSIARLVITSTQFVCEPGYTPKTDLDYRPHTAYGASKVAMEQMAREFDLPCAWTIVRPTTIWGPWLARHERQVFRALRWRLYLHPGHQPVIRSWGYVENTIDQICKLMTRCSSETHGQVFYVGDQPLNLLDWVNAFSRRIRGRNVRIVPRGLVRGLALAGDLFSVLGFDAPLTSSRYRSMTQDYICPMDKTFDLLGPSLFSLEEGVDRTIHWLNRSEGYVFPRDCGRELAETTNNNSEVVAGPWTTSRTLS